MFDLNLPLDVFVALFVMLNPLLAIPIFLSLTADDSPAPALSSPRS